jgi:hypothetical protein
MMSTQRLAPSALFPRSLIIGLGMLGICSPCRGNGGGPASPHTSVETCTIQQVSRLPLRVAGGMDLYVEPVAFSASGQDILLAGWPTFLQRRDSAGFAVDIPRDDIFGVVVGRDREPRIIHSPIQSRLLGPIHARPRPEGGWDVIFYELTPFPAEVVHRPDSVARLWVGVLHASGWRELETVPIREFGLFPTTQGSQVLRRSDTLYWAVVTADHWRRDVAILRRSNARWEAERVMTARATYVDLLIDSAGPVVAVVHPDSTATGDDVNSLFVYSRDSGTWAARRIAIGRRAPTHHPRFSVSAAGADLTWSAVDSNTGRHRGMAAAGVQGGTPIDPIVIDSSLASPYPMQRVVLGNGTRLWSSHHRGSTGEPSTIRFSESDGRSVRVVGEFPTPYAGGFRAVARGTDELITTGTLWDPESKTVASLLIRLRARACGGR